MKAALVISVHDNVATALDVLDSGRTLDLGGHHVLVTERIPSGHKVALVAIAAGEPVLKYGSPIGLATAPIAAGAHVHTHNVASSRGRGDLARPAQSVSGPRLAEPDLDSPEGSRE